MNEKIYLRVIYLILELQILSSGRGNLFLYPTRDPRSRYSSTDLINFDGEKEAMFSFVETDKDILKTIDEFYGK
jgi:hypothetical protein